MQKTCKTWKGWIAKTCNKWFTTLQRWHNAKCISNIAHVYSREWKIFLYVTSFNNLFENKFNGLTLYLFRNLTPTVDSIADKMDENKENWTLIYNYTWSEVLFIFWHVWTVYNFEIDFELVCACLIDKLWKMVHLNLNAWLHHCTLPWQRFFLLNNNRVVRCSLGIDFIFLELAETTSI